MKAPLFLNDVGLVCALGSGQDEVWPRLLAGDTSGLVQTGDALPGHTLTVGRVASDGLPVPEALWEHNSRNNRLLLEAAAQLQGAVDTLLSRVGRGRVGVVLGTSTTGIAEGQAALGVKEATGSWPTGFSLRQQELGSPAVLLAAALGLEGPAVTVSTACTSGAKALASARRLMAVGACDAVLVGGVDTLCGLTLAGFGALEALSPTRCNPFSRNRDGLNIGEGAALFVLSRDEGPVRLLGVGASSDAHHMSAPHPEGRGAIAAMQRALADASLPPGAVDYVNLHGTATPLNDAMEARAMVAVFGEALPPASSTKPMTGHTLGAAGALEAAFCWLALSAKNTTGGLPAHVWDGQGDPDAPTLKLTDTPLPVFPRVAMSNSFAFGGNNVSVLLGRAA